MYQPYKQLHKLAKNPNGCRIEKVDRFKHLLLSSNHPLCKCTLCQSVYLKLGYHFHFAKRQLKWANDIHGITTLKEKCLTLRNLSNIIHESHWTGKV